MLQRRLTAENLSGSEVLEARRNLAIQGPGSIIQAGPRAELSYFPFETSQYSHRALLGSLQNPGWIQIREQTPADLVPLNPYCLSKFRKGLQVWDAAVGIPSPVGRPARTLKIGEVPILRNCNRYWNANLTRALGRVGALGPSGAWLRPSDPFILDLVTHPQGWKIREAIHALGHLTGDTRPREHRSDLVYAGRTGFREQQFLAQIAVCLAYGLPFDTWMLEEGHKGEPDIFQYGLEVKSSSNFRNPVLLLPCCSPEAARPDETVALVSVGIYIEPHPAALTQGTDRWQEINRFCCTPTAAVIAGWECIDVVTHQAICAARPGTENELLCYGMAPQDLQGADTLPALLAQAIQARGLPRVDNQRYWYVDEWLESKAFEALLDRTPPVPCLDCMRFNMRAEGAPRRPFSEPPEKPLTRQEHQEVLLGKRQLSPEDQEWFDWEIQLTKARDLIESAVVFYETTLTKNRRQVRLRRMRRRANHKRKLKDLEGIRKLEGAVKRALQQGRPSLIAGLKLKRLQLIRELGLQGVEECSSSELTSGSVGGSVHSPGPIIQNESRLP